MEDIGLKIPHMETIAKTAELFGVSQYFVRKLANSGQIVAVRIAGRILINCDKFVEYLNSVTLDSTTDKETGNTPALRFADYKANGIRRLG